MLHRSNDMNVFSYLLQPGCSSSARGNLLEFVLEPVLDNSMRRAVARHGTLCSKRGPGRACNWRDQAGKLMTSIGKSSLSFLVFVTVLFCNTMAVAQDYRGSAEQRAACTPDAFRFCAGYILRRAKLSSA